ncbi:Neuronal growth regulator 1 [Varanus komodoensis]|nr:Neuronal growth regulator 1 [Varanus komodoensis]
MEKQGSSQLEATHDLLTAGKRKRSEEYSSLQAFWVNACSGCLLQIDSRLLAAYRLINGQQGITIKSFSSRSFLNFNNVTEEHFGNYTCVAANKLGTTNASLLLNRKSRNMMKNIHAMKGASSLP